MIKTNSRIINADLVISCKSADSNPSTINFNKKLCVILKKRKLNNYYYAEIEYYNNELIVYLRQNPSNNTFQIYETSEYNKLISFSNGKKYNTKCKRISEKLIKEMNKLFKNTPTSVVFELIQIKANILYFKFKCEAQNIIIGDPTETMSNILGEAIENNNFIKELITDNNIMISDDGTFK